MAQDGLKTYEETLKRYRDQQARLNSLAEGSEPIIQNNEDTELTPLDNNKDYKDTIIKYLEGKILPQKKEEVKDDSNGVSLDEYRKRRANELEQTNPELLKKIQEVNPAYKPISNEIKNFNVSDYLNNSMDLAMSKNPDNNVQIPFKPMLSDIANTTQSAPQQTIQQNQIPQQTQQNIKQEITTNKGKIDNQNQYSTGSTLGNKQLDPLTQYQQLLKMQEEKDLASKNELAQAQKERDFASALGMISSGLSKAAAGYGGGSVTELKGDTTAEQALVGQADQKIADIKERMKSATDNEKKILERQLTLAQLQKMRDDEKFNQDKLQLERDKLTAEKEQNRLLKENPKLTPDEVKMYSENRKIRNEAIKVEPKFKELLSKTDNAINLAKEYSKNNAFGTGIMAKLKSKTESMSPETQDLKSALNELSLDNMVSMFSGFAKAIDSEGERKFYQETQPEIGDDDKVLMNKLQRRRAFVQQKINNIQGIKSEITREGRFTDNNEAQVNQSQQNIVSQPTTKKDWMK